MSLQISNDETYKVLQELVTDPNFGDNFRVKVVFRPSPSALPVTFATFRNVTFEQIISPEPWLEQLSGGTRGVFDLSVSHEAATSKKLGGDLRVAFHSGKADLAFNWPALEDADYRGPAEVMFPTRTTASAAPAVAASPVALPKKSDGSAEALAGVIQTLVTQRPAAAPAPGPDPFARLMELQLAAQAQEEKRRAEDRLREEKREEDRRNREEERQRREDERRREEKKEEREREEKRAQQEREHQRWMEERAAKQQEMMIQLLTKSDPIRDAMLQKAINGGDEAGQKAAALIAQMGGFMSQMTGMTVQLLHTQAELNQGPVESPIWNIAGKLIDGYFSTVSEQNEELTEALTETVAEETKKLPAASTSAEGAEPASLDGLDDTEAEEEGEEDTESEEAPSTETPLARFDRAIFEMAPPRELADALCLALVTPDFQQLFAGAKGDLRKLITDRYGKWVSAPEVKDESARKRTAAKRLAYLASQLPAAWKVAQQRGIIRPPPKKDAPHNRAQPKPAKKPAAKKEEPKAEEPAPAAEEKK